MISVNNLRQGTYFRFNNELLKVLSFSHIKMARGGAVIKTKVKNLETGATSEKSFKNNDNVEDFSIERHKAQFLYTDGTIFNFMDNATFEQIEISKEKIGEAAKFLKDGIEVQIVSFEDKILDIELPTKEVYEVTQTDPGLKGDTVSGGSKPAAIETGATLSVPLFIKIGDKIRINTLEGKYVERAN